MLQPQEGLASPKAEPIELDQATGRPNKLSYGLAQTIALLITAGVMIVFTLLIALLSSSM